MVFRGLIWFSRFSGLSIVFTCFICKLFQRLPLFDSVELHLSRITGHDLFHGFLPSKRWRFAGGARAPTLLAAEMA